MTDAPIVHLSTETGWRGGERQVFYLARGLAGRAQAVAAPADSPLARACAGLGMPVLALPAKPLLAPRALWRLRGWLRARPGALLHAHGSRALDAARWLARLAPCGPLVHTRRVAFPLRPSAKYRTVCACYVAISRAIADQLAAVGTPAERIRTIPSAVDFAALDTAEPIASPFPGHPLVVCVAQMTAEKGVAVLAQAWARVVATVPAARLALVGDGPERPAVEAALAGVAGVHLAGFRDDVPRWLRAATVYVQPSHAEGLGSTAIDAAACGVPLVCSRVGGLPEVVGDGGGLLVPPGDPAALAEAIVRLLGDADLAARCGAAARAHARATFAIDGMVAAYRALYDGLLAR